jgi:hypothetical protein
VRSARPERGQATVEAVALWLIVAAIFGALLLGLPRLGPLLAGALHGGEGRTAAREPAAAALAERALAGRGGRGGTPTLLAAERMLALELGAGGARAYLASRLEARHGARLGHVIDATALVGGAEAPGDRLFAYPSGRPSLTIAHLADEPLPQPDAATRRAVAAAGTDAAATALELVRATRPLATLFGRVQAGQAVIGLLAPRDDVGPEPGRRAGDAVLCEPVELRWTMGGEVHRTPLALALHLVVVRAGRVLDDRLIDGERCP